MEPSKAVCIRTDDDGSQLIAEPWSRRADVTLSITNGDFVDVNADDFAEITEKLFEVAHEDPVLVIARQQVPENGGPIRYGDFVIGLEGDRVAVGIRGTTEGSVMPPGAAMVLSGYIAAYALRAREEPDPAEVDELAGAIHVGNWPSSSPLEASDEDRAAARTALRWMNARKAAASAPEAAR